MNHAARAGGMTLGLIVIAMRQHGPHIAKILARQAIAEAQHLHARTGVVGFDIAGPERGNPPRLFREAYEIARLGGLGLTAHAGEDAPPDYIWQAVDGLGVTRVGHGCAAAGDQELLRRLARDGIVVECCLSSNYHTGAVARGARHPIVSLLEAGVKVAICCDNTTVSRTDQAEESLRVAEQVGVDQVEAIHAAASGYSFIRPESRLAT
jgi:adenosine deaminase